MTDCAGVFVMVGAKRRWLAEAIQVARHDSKTVHGCFKPKRNSSLGTGNRIAAPRVYDLRNAKLVPGQGPLRELGTRTP
jgi:hypothetical protein